jgi:hypothetical protein
MDGFTFFKEIVYAIWVPCKTWNESNRETHLWISLFFNIVERNWIISNEILCKQICSLAWLSINVHAKRKKMIHWGILYEQKLHFLFYCKILTCHFLLVKLRKELWKMYSPLFRSIGGWFGISIETSIYVHKKMSFLWTWTLLKLGTEIKTSLKCYSQCLLRFENLCILTKEKKWESMWFFSGRYTFSVL